MHPTKWSTKWSAIFIFIRLGGHDYPGKIYLQYAYICFIFSFSRYSTPGAVWLGMVLAIDYGDWQKAVFMAGNVAE